MYRLISLFGMLVILVICYLLSTSRKRISWRIVISGSLLQLILAAVILKTKIGPLFFDKVSKVFEHILGFGEEGSVFVFGELSTARIFGFYVLPMVIFFSAVMAVLYHLRIMDRLVYFAALIMRKTLGTSGAESLSAATNIFMGQTEAPLVVGPYIKTMTKSELMAVMSGGMATIAGSVMAAYIAILSGQFPDIAGHLMAASLMSAPASLVFAKILVPETEEPETGGDSKIVFEKQYVNVIEAAAGGTTQGVKLALNIGGMLIAFLGLVALLNFCWGHLCLGFTWATGMETSAIDSFQELLGYVFAPFAWLIGIPTQDIVPAGMLLGEKTVLNEFIAYSHLGNHLNGQAIAAGIPAHAFTLRSQVILTYALCGFANLSSIGILLGGLGGIAPERRSDLSRLGLRALLAGTFASFQTAAIAGMLL